jgi:hypothetical protein
VLLTTTLESRTAGWPQSHARAAISSGMDSRLKSHTLTNSLERALAILEFIAHKSRGAHKR